MKSELAIVAVTAVAACGAVALMLPFARAHLRSACARRTPTGAGLGMVLAAVATTLVSAHRFRASRIETGLVVASVCWLALVGFWDDLRSLSPYWRLVAHFAAAGVVLLALPAPTEIVFAGMAAPALPWLWVPIALGGCVWIVNLTNFMDGVDGLAGAQGVVGCAALAIILGQAGLELTEPSVCLLLAMTGACVGFLVWNWPPARTFMGDVGSTALGLIFAIGVLRGAAIGIDITLLLLPIAPFLVDATATLLRRVWRGQPLLRRHTTHGYQHLVRAWAGHRPVTLLYATCALVTAAIAILVHDRGWPPGPIAAGCAVLLLVLIGSFGSRARIPGASVRSARPTSRTA